MADIATIAEAKIQAFGVKQFFGVMPDMDIQETYVRLYYTPDKLEQVQRNFSKIMSAAPGPIRYNFQPVVVPYTIKTFGLAIFGLFVFGFFVGRYA